MLNDTIDSLATSRGIVVTRHLAGARVNGKYAPGAASTFTIDCVIEPAYNLNRVIGGADLHAKVDNQDATDVRQLWTTTLLKTRSPTTDPDVITFEDADWTIARVERWELDGQVHYHCVASKLTGGAS